MSKLKKALQRATEAKTGTPLSPKHTTGDRRIHPLLKKHGITEPATETKDIKITYSKTRVEHVDKRILKKNKIFSAFKNNRTTDQVDILRTQVLSKLSEKGGNSILVTSCYPGEGKTFTAINLGVSLSQQLDRTVLLVDTDLRHPWKYHYDFSQDFWGLHPKKGLSDYLMGQAEIEELIINPGIDKLTIIPAGKPLPNSAELLASDRMKQFIHNVKSRFGNERICIFDSPALLYCTDPLVFSGLLDGVLLVVEAERTTADELKKVLKLLDSKFILGTVFNKTKGDDYSNYV
jgi:protein-tyrosine kinase